MCSLRHHKFNIKGIFLAQFCSQCNNSFHYVHLHEPCCCSVSQSVRSNGGTTAGIETRQKSMKSAENQLTMMLLLVTTLFLILLCPTYFRFIYLVFAKRDTPFEYAKSMIIFQISGALYITNSGINFFLYCISGQRFRNDLKEILSCCGCNQKLYSSATENSITTIC